VTHSAVASSSRPNTEETFIQSRPPAGVQPSQDLARAAHEMHPRIVVPVACKSCLTRQLGVPAPVVMNIRHGRPILAC
jgi:hypothetical protein